MTEQLIPLSATALSAMHEVARLQDVNARLLAALNHLAPECKANCAECDAIGEMLLNA